MLVKFRTKALRNQYETSGKAIAAYGKAVGRKYIQRINIIKTTRNINELAGIRALRCHPLKGKRDGEWAIDLSDFYRLIFTVQGDKMEIIRIEEVSKHYDD